MNNYLNQIIKKRYLYYLLSRKINVDNLEVLSLNQINKIGEKYEKDYFISYKKYIFYKWKEVNQQDDELYINRMRKLITKLNLNFYNYELQNIQYLYARNFTFVRFLKTLEAPYEPYYQGHKISNIIYFLYKNVREYRINDDGFFSLNYKGELIFSGTELVFYDREQSKICNVIKFHDIKRLVLYDYGVIISIRGNQKICYRYKDNYIIYITFKKLAKKFKANVKIESKISNKKLIL